MWVTLQLKALLEGFNKVKYIYPWTPWIQPTLATVQYEQYVAEKIITLFFWTISLNLSADSRTLILNSSWFISTFRVRVVFKITLTKTTSKCIMYIYIYIWKYKYLYISHSWPNGWIKANYFLFILKNFICHLFFVANLTFNPTRASLKLSWI